MSAENLQWALVGAIVVAAVIMLVRLLRRNPCGGCPIADNCRRNRKKNCKKSS